MRLLRGTFVVVLAALVMGVMPNATAAGTTSPVSSVGPSWTRVFDTSSLPTKARSAAEEAIAAFDFDWTRLSDALNGRRITVASSDLSALGAVGAAWPAPVARIEIDDDTLGHPIWIKAVMLHELGHAVDFYYLQPQGLTDDVAAIYGRDWDMISHSFNAAFIAAFTAYEATDDAYPLTRAQIAEVRELLGGTGWAPSSSQRKDRSARIPRIVMHRHFD